MREDMDLTQAQVGAAILRSQRTYGYYESGERMVPPEVLILLAKFHNTSVDYILGVTDEMTPYPRRKKKTVDEL